MKAKEDRIEFLNVTLGEKMPLQDEDKTSDDHQPHAERLPTIKVAPQTFFQVHHFNSHVSLSTALVLSAILHAFMHRLAPLCHFQK